MNTSLQALSFCYQVARMRIPYMIVFITAINDKKTTDHLTLIIVHVNYWSVSHNTSIEHSCRELYKSEE